MRFYILLLGLIIQVHSSFCQHVTLKRSITGDIRPSDTSLVERPKVQSHLNNFSGAGYDVGDTIPDFTLYTTDGVAVHMDSVLSDNKPVLLVAGSYSCPFTRARLNDFKSISRYYRDKLNTYMVYVVEAHPEGQQCPYEGFGSAPAPRNSRLDITIKRAVTYGQRRKMAIAMKEDHHIQAPILIDGPKNEWWSHFGPAPNNAYLINSKGIIVAKNAWFNSIGGQTMWCYIDELLGTHSGVCK
jgi:hypothetical protein